jgi:hypothetical protein
MSNEVVEQNNTPVSNMTLGDWGQPQVNSKDIIIPKILVMQGLSQLVTDDKAKMGDFVDSMTEEVLGNYKDKSLAFIPFHMESIWIISKKEAGAGDYTFDSIVDVDSSNENWRYNEVIDNVEYKREYCRNFYVLRPEDTSLPYIISFKGMSSKAGKILATQMYVRNAAAGKIPPAFVMELFGNKDKNDKGTFITLATKVERESSEEEIAKAFQWFKTVTGGGVKPHEAKAEEVEQTEMF